MFNHGCSIGMRMTLLGRMPLHNRMTFRSIQ